MIELKPVFFQDPLEKHNSDRPLTRKTKHIYNTQVSSPEESHLKALSEPDMNLSAHPAPTIQPFSLA